MARKKVQDPQDPNAPAATDPNAGRALAFPAPPGVRAEVDRLVAEGMTLGAVKAHLAAEAAELLAPLAGQVRAIVGRRMGFLPIGMPGDHAPEPAAE